MKLAIIRGSFIAVLFISIAAVLLSGPITSTYVSKVKKGQAEITEKVFESPTSGFPAGLRSDFEVRIVSRTDGAISHRITFQAVKIFFEHFSSPVPNNFLFINFSKHFRFLKIDRAIVLLRLLI